MQTSVYDPRRRGRSRNSCGLYDVRDDISAKDSRLEMVLCGSILGYLMEIMNDDGVKDKKEPLYTVKTL